MFVKLHSEPILENLLQEFKLRYQGHKMPAKLMDKFVYSTPSSSSFKPTEIKSNSQSHFIRDLVQHLNVDFLLDLQENEMMNKVKHVKEENSVEKDEMDEISATNTWVNTQNKSIAYVPIEFPPLPRKGNFNIRNVLDSDYFFH
ncbi:hypothetical protein HMI55_004415 [Coelomomyces lativittatus]|nr:hypothetical protein HMI55_004415 [Coelomomyces lativittatus]